MSRLDLAAFGLSLQLQGPAPPGAWQARPPRGHSLQIQMADTDEIEDRWSGFEAIGWQGAIDGAPFVVERGRDGDHRFVHGERPNSDGMPSAGTHAIHHLNAGADLLRCAPSDPQALAWWRVVLDSVLFTVALLQGYEALHAGAIATPEGVIAITATTGGGKSTLLAELLAQGAALMADDVLVLEPRDMQPPLAHPAPPLMTLPVRPGIAETAETILTIDGERWVSVAVNPEPLTLKALVVLDRRPAAQMRHSEAELTKIESPLAPLMEALMRFPRTPERERARFELASAMSAGVDLWRLTAALNTPPDVLADTLLAGAL